VNIAITLNLGDPEVSGFLERSRALSGTHLAVTCQVFGFLGYRSLFNKSTFLCKPPMRNIVSFSPNSANLKFN
jgi:hypothetical protein